VPPDQGRKRPTALAPEPGNGQGASDWRQQRVSLAPGHQLATEREQLIREEVAVEWLQGMI
jgi:hypothetical protein